MATKSVIAEVREITLAIELIELGARLQLLEAETSLSRDRLIKLYKELRGASPPKGMLPFSTDWFMTWQPNIHSSLFHGIYRFIGEHGGADVAHSPIQAIVKSYRLYLEHVALYGDEAVLSLTRAWTLVRYFESGMLQTNACTRCGGRFVAHAYDLRAGYVCGLCQPPSRAGKTRKAGESAAARRMAA
ncbi:flagellar transcriptional regulator FlhC [Caballeronia insecticola]|uniref:Flagellar transcriptional regulator FlhC n=1 Tax=Caballeronia insecticola TaxID=758793 RepID=R4WSM0_9BURK|nr:flagellar transcriptional regulator FlhC [Caballeronia insecticola]BAN21876.1 flagellar transcriptional regulator FlhC [Caballeronia insecticola]